jgi:hypothetical protein
MKRAQLPGTNHSSTFNRQERSILAAIASAPSVQKLKTGRMALTGPTLQQRLCLWVEEIPGTDRRFYVGWLFTGSGKRYVKLYPASEVNGHSLAQELASILARQSVTLSLVSKG